jgi:hypothetical protein
MPSSLAVHYGGDWIGFEQPTAEPAAKIVQNIGHRKSKIITALPRQLFC